MNLPLCLSETGSVTIISGDLVQKLHFVSGSTVSQVVASAFPFGLNIVRSRVWSCQGRCWVSDQDFAVCGVTYQVYFSPMQVLIEPFGLLWLDPGMKIYEVQDYCSKRFFGQSTAVFLRANGLFLNGAIALCRAAAIGVSMFSL